MVVDCSVQDSLNPAAYDTTQDFVQFGNTGERQDGYPIETAFLVQWNVHMLNLVDMIKEETITVYRRGCSSTSWQVHTT